MPYGDSTSASGIISGFLSQFGLQELGQWAWDLYTGADGGPGASLPEIELLLPQQEAFKQRFPAYEALAKDNRAITPGAYIAYENQVRGYLQQYGVPNGMYDTPAQIASLLINDVSAEEVAQRLTLAANAAVKAPQEVKDALLTQYGGTIGDLVGFYLDPDLALPLIEQRQASAYVMGAANRQGFAIDVAQADRLAAQNVGYEQAVQGFGQAYQMRDLSNELFAGGGGGQVSEGQRIGAAFGDAQSADAAARTAAKRAAAYQKSGGGAAASQAGVSGLGSANS